MLLETPSQIKQDKDFVKNEIKPSVDFVKNFVADSGRLPNNREYYRWQRNYHKDYSCDLTQQEDSLIPGTGRISYIRKPSDILNGDEHKFEDADWTTDYAIGVWRGEWMEYYFSWTDSYDTNNYSWKDGIIGLLYSAIIGFIPLLFRLIKTKKST